MNNPTAPPQYDDEIDLKDLLKKIIRTLERGTKTILISVVLGAILGMGYFFKGKETFESSMVLSSNILVLANIQALFTPLELLLEEENYEVLAQKLGIEEEAVNSLVALEVESVFENEDDNEARTSYFEITATVTNNAVLPEIQQGIVNYLKNNDYIQKRVTIKTQRLDALIEKVNIELQEIDSLKNRLESGAILNSGGSNVVLMEPTNIYQQALLMEEKKQSYKEQLAFVESIQLIKEFTPFANPSSPSWILCLVVGLAGGLIIGFAILFFQEMDRYVRS